MTLNIELSQAALFWLIGAGGLLAYLFVGAVLGGVAGRVRPGDDDAVPSWLMFWPIFLASLALAAAVYCVIMPFVWLGDRIAGRKVGRP